MTNKEKKIVAALLDMAGDIFGNHGCSDFDLREKTDLTKEEMVALGKHARELMSYFADRLRSEVDDV